VGQRLHLWGPTFGVNLGRKGSEEREGIIWTTNHRGYRSHFKRKQWLAPEIPDMQKVEIRGESQFEAI
jgi:hypothetical protein